MAIRAGQHARHARHRAGVFGGKWLTITMPELADFADQRFLENHCFDFGGIDVVDGDTLLRDRLQPGAGRAHARRRRNDLSRSEDVSAPRDARVARQSDEAASRRRSAVSRSAPTFKEVIPGVPVIDVVSSVVFPRDDPKRPPLEPSTEDQRALSVRFLKGKPVEQVAGLRRRECAAQTDAQLSIAAT